MVCYFRDMENASVRLDGRAIGAVIFDFGEVLSYPPPAGTITKMAELLRTPAEKFREYYYAERHPYDCGEISSEEYWRAVARDAGAQVTAEQIEWLRRTDVEMWSVMNPQMLSWAAQLRSIKVQTAVLSNMHADMARSVRKECHWIGDFHCFVLSAEVGSAKPEPQIYQHCLDCLKVTAKQALFIDDKPRNTRAAEDLGLAVVCADSAEKIREQLEGRGWTGPLPQKGIDRVPRSEL
jgi:putative hydrolase of the HAD superfamily